MEENHPIEKKIRETLRDYDPAPPGSAWNNIRNRIGIQDETRDTSFWNLVIPLHQQRTFRIVLGVAAFALILFLVLVWMFAPGHRAISGSAWAGEERLCKGTACLYKVDDITAPFDSVKEYRKVSVSEKGQYRFPEVGMGRYLLKVVPEEGSEHSGSHKPSWYDQRSAEDDPLLIEVGEQDLVVNIVLQPKEK